eukprot:4495559-Alexandrium_andersonii.AAC.1
MHALSPEARRPRRPPARPTRGPRETDTLRCDLAAALGARPKRAYGSEPGAEAPAMTPAPRAHGWKAA